MKDKKIFGYLAFGILYWIVYLYTIYPGWMVFAHSDNAVPYIMTREPWIPQDYFYWMAWRFGAAYMVLWKSVGKFVFGNTTEAFFLGHMTFFFLGTGF